MDNEYFNRNTDVARIDTEGNPSEETHEDKLRDVILENARGPKRVEGDSGSVEQHSLKDQIEAERFLAAKEATRKPGLGIKFTKIAADGTV